MESLFLVFSVLLAVAGFLYAWIISPCVVGSHDWYSYRDEWVDLHDHQAGVRRLVHAFVCVNCGRLRDDISAEKQRQVQYLVERDARHVKAERQLRALRERGVIR